MTQSAAVLERSDGRAGDGILGAYTETLALVERLHRLLLDVIKDEFERLERFDLNPVQALLLFNIGDKVLTAGELKTRGHYQGSNVSYNLKKLFELGYVHHERSEQDRRSVRVRLTKTGGEVHDLVGALFARHSSELAGRLEPLGIEGMNEQLRTVERFWTEEVRYIY